MNSHLTGIYIIQINRLSKLEPISFRGGACRPTIFFAYGPGADLLRHCIRPIVMHGSNILLHIRFLTNQYINIYVRHNRLCLCESHQDTFCDNDLLYRRLRALEDAFDVWVSQHVCFLFSSAWV